MACFDLGKVNLAYANVLKRSNPDCNGNRSYKVELRTTCIKNFQSISMKIRTSCQYVGYIYYSDNLNWAAQNLRLGRGLDIAGVNPLAPTQTTLLLEDFLPFPHLYCS